MSRSVGPGLRAMAFVALASFAVAGPAAPRARAQPTLQSAERALENAEFERALRELSAIEADESLSFDAASLVLLLRLRAVASAALGRDDDAQMAIRGLSTVLGGREPEALPPPLDEAYERLRTTVPLEVHVTLTREVGDQVRASVAVRGDPGELTRHVSLRCAIDGREVVRTRGDRLAVRAADGLVCTAEAIGPAGYGLGQHEARWMGAAVEDDWNPYGEPPPRRRVGAWVGGVLAGVAVVAGAVALGVVLSRGGGGLEGPTWVTAP